jgi:hypothetical protein
MSSKEVQNCLKNDNCKVCLGKKQEFYGGGTCPILVEENIKKDNCKKELKK